MHVEILVGAPEFWERLKQDLRTARASAYVQTFTFEGDQVGAALGRALEACVAVDRKLLIDGYSLLYHNDRLIPGPAWLGRSFRREVASTWQWVGRLRRAGAGVRFGNPIGPSPLRLARRNHKKLVVIDERVAYLGGINFSEHNFAWHDMMLRLEAPDLGRVLANDFRRSWCGQSVAFDRAFGAIRVISLNGRGNARRMRPVIDAIESARFRIDAVSPYLSPPFTDRLASARRRGVHVRVLTPAENNKSNLARHVLHAAHRHGFEVALGAGMSHMKAMLIDNELLIAGSCNFDSMGYYILEDLILMTRAPVVVDRFRSSVWEADLERAVPIVPRASIGTRLGHAAVRVGAACAATLALS